MTAIGNGCVRRLQALFAVILGLMSGSIVAAQTPGPSVSPPQVVPSSASPSAQPSAQQVPDDPLKRLDALERENAAARAEILRLKDLIRETQTKSAQLNPGEGASAGSFAPDAGLSPGVPGLYAPPTTTAQQTSPLYLPRPIADYAPPGLLPRPPQAGAAYPLYTPLEVPRPTITPEDRSKFVTEGIYPGTYLIPRINTSLKFYGFVRVDGIFDFNPIGSTDDFVTNSIPIPQGRGQNEAVNPRYTRLGFMSYTPTPVNDWIFQTKLEMDFFNGNTSGAFGSFPIRLRFAYADWGYFRVGQDASVFMDYDVFPNVLDYEGPPGMVLMRQPVFRVTLPLGDQVHWAVALEQPFSDITPSEGGKGIQDVPDLTTNLRYDAGLGHVQLSGLLRKITNQPVVVHDQTQVGWGVNLTGDFHPWAALMGSNPATKENPNGLERSRFLGQYASGFGINRYIQDVNGLGLDAAAGPGGLFRLIQATGWFGAYEHWWTEKWSTTLVYGETRSFLPASLDLPPNTYKAAQYSAVNLVWVPLPNLMTGIEYLWGSRTNLDGQAGFARRIQVAVQYNF
jgi:hypothetical protein